MTVSDLVKALEWHNFDAWTWWAEAVCCTYQVEERNGGWRVELRFHDARHVVTETDDFDAALSAVQADYTVRILAALDLSAVEALEAENKRLRSLLDRWVNIATHCDITDGMCCCGDDMGKHSRDAGHSPTDHGAYVADKTLFDTLAALKERPHA
jgi:hypothetical protein